MKERTKFLAMGALILLSIFNLCHSLKAIDPWCEYYATWECTVWAEVRCENRCSSHGGCVQIDFWGGSCIAGEFCYQDFILHCDDGYQTYLEDCPTWTEDCRPYNK
jgi:hypothetical protein